ncbi:hypothetical protein [Pontixanthobacter sp. CEM42]|uniref:hypothetical protein n=1 Tax=Pontixanthobacter sp. CEM42 TaxID=2792077 RepID=UPI001ADF6BAB|nr:hypothetical protein [Pontixanthobacter sp. CEM42]
MRRLSLLTGIALIVTPTASFAGTFETTINRATYTVDLDTVKSQRLEGMTADALIIPVKISNVSGNRSEHMIAALCGTTETEHSEGARLYVRQATLAWKSYDKDGKLEREWQMTELKWKVPRYKTAWFKVIDAACVSKGL